METSLRACVQQSLDALINDNAVLLAEQLFSDFSTLENLALLGRCHVASGNTSAATTLFQNFHPLHDVLPPTSASPLPANAATLRRPLRPGVAMSSPLGQCLYVRGVAEAKTQRWAQAQEALLLLVGDGTGAVSYWLGVCAKHLSNVAVASEQFRESVATNPAMIISVENGSRIDPRAMARTCESSFANASQRGSAGTPTTATVPRPSGPAGRSSTALLAQQQQQQQQQGTSSPANAEVLARLQACAKTSTTLWVFDSAAARASLNGFSPGNPWAMEHAGLAAFHAGDMASAVTHFRTLLESHPWCADREWVVTYSTALWFAKKDAALGALAQRMISHHRHSAYTMCVVGNAYSLASNAASAHAMFHRATLIDPTFAYAHTLCGLEAMALGEREQASENFLKALNCDPRHYSAFAGIGDYYTKSEALPNARAHLQKAIQINPLPVIMNRLAATYHAQGFASESDLRSALAIYDQVLHKHPRNFAATHQRATVLLRLGHADTARESLERVIDEVGEDAALHMTLGQCYARLGLTTKAIACFRRSADLDPRRAQAAKTQIERLGAK